MYREGTAMNMSPDEAEKHLQDILTRYPEEDRSKLGEELQNIFNLTCDRFFSDQIGDAVQRDLTDTERARIDNIYRVTVACTQIIIKFASQGDVRYKRLLKNIHLDH